MPILSLGQKIEPGGTARGIAYFPSILEPQTISTKAKIIIETTENKYEFPIYLRKSWANHVDILKEQGLEMLKPLQKPVLQSVLSGKPMAIDEFVLKINKNQPSIDQLSCFNAFTSKQQDPKSIILCHSSRPNALFVHELNSDKKIEKIAIVGLASIDGEYTKRQERMMPFALTALNSQTDTIHYNKMMSDFSHSALQLINTIAKTPFAEVFAKKSVVTQKYPYAEGFCQISSVSLFPPFTTFALSCSINPPLNNIFSGFLQNYDPSTGFIKTKVFDRILSISDMGWGFFPNNDPDGQILDFSKRAIFASRLKTMQIDPNNINASITVSGNELNQIALKTFGKPIKQVNSAESYQIFLPVNKTDKDYWGLSTVPESITIQNIWGNLYVVYAIGMKLGTVNVATDLITTLFLIEEGKEPVLLYYRSH